MDILSSLPDEIVVHIMIFLDVSSLYNLDLVTKRYRILSGSNTIWNIRLKKIFPWLKPESIPQSNHQTFVKSIQELINHVRTGISSIKPDIRTMEFTRKIDPNQNCFYPVGAHSEIRIRKDFIIDIPPYHVIIYNEIGYEVEPQVYLHSSLQISQGVLGFHILYKNKSNEIMYMDMDMESINMKLSNGSYREFKFNNDLGQFDWKFGLEIGYLCRE